MVKASLAALIAALVLVVGEAPASPHAKQDLKLAMDDGVQIAATLYLPDGSAPAGGWPALVFLHGLSGKRQDMNTLVEGYGFVGGDYAVLTFDARGHGASGGLVGIDGPREVADVRAIRDWLAARPDVSDTKIGAWGISYGGGAIFNSLAAGVRWGAAVTVETWTDLYSALMPQGLVKSGLVAGLASSIPPERRDPSLNALQAAAFAGNTAVVKPWAAERSSLSKLSSVQVPVLMAQGRRDFLFGIDQASLAMKELKGQKFLFIGNHGHAPSTFPASDSGFLMAQARGFFDCFLRIPACDTIDRSTLLAPQGWNGTGTLTSSPTGSNVATKTSTFSLPGVTTIGKGGKAVRTTRPLSQAIEIFGSPTVTVSLAASGGWSRLVAVLTAKTPKGDEIVVSAGGVPTKEGARKATIRLIDQATHVPKGSKLQLTLASSSTAQSPGNLLYLDLPMPASSRARIGTAVLKLPVLRTPVTK